jgi:hypothetical protein
MYVCSRISYLVECWRRLFSLLCIFVFKLKPPLLLENSDSSVSIVTGYGLDDRGSRVRFPAEAGNFSLHHRVQIGSGAHSASFPMGKGGSFPGGTAAGV